jgi:Fe-S-cluster containining protein
VSACYRWRVRDGPFRRTLKRLARWHFDVNLGVHRWWRRRRGDRPFLLGGACGRCAACCEAPAIAVGRAVWFLPTVRRLFLAWQRRVNGFELTGRDRGSRTFVFRCTHFDPASRSCDSYDSRPGMCRDYPRLLLWQPAPEMLEGCGYRALPPNVAALRESLARLDLTDVQKERLRRGLGLDDEG